MPRRYQTELFKTVPELADLNMKEFLFGFSPVRTNSTLVLCFFSLLATFINNNVGQFVVEFCVLPCRQLQEDKISVEFNKFNRAHAAIRSAVDSGQVVKINLYSKTEAKKEATENGKERVRARCFCWALGVGWLNVFCSCAG